MVRANTDAVGALDTGCDDLPKLTDYMNETFSKPTHGDRVNMERRTTILTPSVKHTISEWKSLYSTRQNY